MVISPQHMDIWTDGRAKNLSSNLRQYQRPHFIKVAGQRSIWILDLPHLLIQSHVPDILPGRHLQDGPGKHHHCHHHHRAVRGPGNCRVRHLCRPEPRLVLLESKSARRGRGRITSAMISILLSQRPFDFTYCLIL